MKKFNPITKVCTFDHFGQVAAKVYFQDGNIQIGYGETKKLAVKDACQKAKEGWRTESNPHKKKVA